MSTTVHNSRMTALRLCMGALQVYNMATAAGVTEAADYAKSIAPVNLIRALLPHTTDAQRDELRSSLSQIQ